MVECGVLEIKPNRCVLKSQVSGPTGIGGSIWDGADVKYYTHVNNDTRSCLRESKTRVAPTRLT